MLKETKSELYGNLNKGWVVGFSDGEGCFNLDVHVKLDMRWKLQMQPEFMIVQHERDKALLESLTTFFGCGSVSVNRKDSTSTRFHFRVKSVAALHDKVIPFFEQNPLITAKNNDFAIFKQIVTLMHKGYHRKSLANFLEIVKLGEELSKRGGNVVKSEARIKKRSRVNQIILDLEAKLKQDPTLK